MGVYRKEGVSGCKLCGAFLAYPGAVFCGAACCAMYEEDRVVKPPENDGADALKTPFANRRITGVGEFATKVSATKHAEGEMVRSPADGKPNFTLIFRGPMLQRWAELLTRGAVNYGADNWTKGLAEADFTIRRNIKKRYKESAVRHFVQWMRGDRDEDHAAAVFFNLNGYEAMLLTDDPTTRAVRLEELYRLIGG